MRKQPNPMPPKNLKRPPGPNNIILNKGEKMLSKPRIRAHNKIKNYRKIVLQPMRPYVPGEDLTGVSISKEDIPELGGMIAIGIDNGAKWYISKTFFKLNYEQV